VARSDWASVTAFGAKGDGTTDDTRAIQAGLDFVQASGIGDSANKTLFFPAGTYLVTTTLLLNYTNGVLLLGTGATTVLLWGGGSAPAPPPDGGFNRLLWSNGNTRFHIEGLVSMARAWGKWVWTTTQRTSTNRASCTATSPSCVGRRRASAWGTRRLRRPQR